MIEPSAVVLYVDKLSESSQFYQDFLGLKPTEDSPTFHSFVLSNGMMLGLKAKHSVEPPAQSNSQGNGELAFTLANREKVSALFTEWEQKNIKIAQAPTALSYGYTFVALDPDGHRLRFVSFDKV